MNRASLRESDYLLTPTPGVGNVYDEYEDQIVGRSGILVGENRPSVIPPKDSIQSIEQTKRKCSIIKIALIGIAGYAAWRIFLK